jgi:glycosyltransferase involved in cell wall biosynthesis
MLTISLVTLGSPDQLTGGYLYHRRMAAWAPAHDARLEFVSVPNWPLALAAATAGRRLRQARQADVTVIDSIAACFLVPWRLPRPAAAIVHQSPGGIDSRVMRRTAQARLDRLVYARCDLLILASRALLDEVCGQRTVVVPPGCDLVVAAPGPLPDLRQGRRAALLSVGNWVKRKGTMDLLTAFGRLPPDAATLHLVGRTDQDPRYGVQVRSRLADPDLAGRVVVHGPLAPDQTARLYAASDVFVLPSYREPYGTVYGEALVAGLPVVGWRAGNLPNLVDDGCEGIVLEPGDITGLTEALLRLAVDDSYRRRLAAGARTRGAGLMTWEQTAAQFYGVLRGLVESAR